MFEGVDFIVDEIAEIIKGQGNVVIENEAIFRNVLKDLVIEAEEKKLIEDFVSKDGLNLLREELNKKKSTETFKKDLYAFIKTNEGHRSLEEKNFLFVVFFGIFYFCATQQKIAPTAYSEPAFLSTEEMSSIKVANAANTSLRISKIINGAKRMIGLIVFAGLVVFIFIFVLIFKACSPDDTSKNDYYGGTGNQNGDSYYTDSSGENEQPTFNFGTADTDDDKNETTENKTPNQTDRNDEELDSSNPQDNDKDVADIPKEPTKTPISGSMISGSIKSETDKFYYTFTPQNSGMHRFDFDISNVNADYEFEITTSKGTSLGEFYYSSRDKGVSLELNAGETYTITVAYDDMSCDYEILIGKPDSLKTITGTSVSASLNYEDKCNEYKYTAPKTGVYRFSFDISNVNADFSFRMYNAKSAEIRKVKYSAASYATNNPGTTISLTAGETYTIWVWQDYLTCDYTINIGVPNDVVNITGSKANGSFKYIDQENTYTYVPAASGTYTFYWDISNSAADFEIRVKNSKNSTIRSTDYAASKYAKKRAEFTEELIAGETYTITVYQDYLLCDYTMEIVKTE